MGEYLRGHDEFVVDDVVGSESHAEQGRRGVQVAGHSRATVHVLADAFESRRLVEVCRTDALAYDVPVLAGRHVRHLQLVHDVLELLAHLAHLPHRLVVDEVFLTPRRRVTAGKRIQWIFKDSPHASIQLHIKLESHKKLTSIRNFEIMNDTFL